MNTDSKKLLLEQWQTLHNSHESYERYALIIKLVAVSLTLASFVFEVNSCLAILIIAITWLQEGIWKTFQQRTSNAILAIEQKLASSEEEPNLALVKPYLFYSEWQGSRQTTIGLIKEYFTNALKPTVMYPYLPLILLAVVF